MSQEAKAIVQALREKKAKKEIDLFEGKKAQKELAEDQAYYEHLEEKDKDFDPEASSDEEEDSSEDEELYEDGFRVKDTEEQPLTQDAESEEEEELSSEEDESSEEEEVPEEVVAKLPPREKMLRSRVIPIPYKVKTQTKYYAPNGQEIKNAKKEPEPKLVPLVSRVENPGEPVHSVSVDKDGKIIKTILPEEKIQPSA
jgi:hypothetical protein